MERQLSGSIAKLRVETQAAIENRHRKPASGTGDVVNRQAPRDHVVDCGWGRVLFAQTFNSSQQLALELESEQPGERDIALYVEAPQVLIAYSPQTLFLDPSVTWRLSLTDWAAPVATPRSIRLQPIETERQLRQLNRIYRARNMQSVRTGYLDTLTEDDERCLLVALDVESGRVVGGVLGIDHVRAFDDSRGGTSLWGLAVDPDAGSAGIGEALISAMVTRYVGRGRTFVDLSVMCANDGALTLYQRLGFAPVSVFAVKKRNAINSSLYLEALDETPLSASSMLVVDEARRRGISVNVSDPVAEGFELELAGRRVHLHNGLTELTSAVALSRCKDSRSQLEALNQAGLVTPDCVAIETVEQAMDQLFEHRRLRLQTNQRGAAVAAWNDLQTPSEIHQAWHALASSGEEVLARQWLPGRALRVLVIDQQIAGALHCMPAVLTGDGVSTVKQLIDREQRRPVISEGTGLECDEQLQASIDNAGCQLNEVLPYAQQLVLKNHVSPDSGGLTRDITGQLSAAVAALALRAASVLNLPVAEVRLLLPETQGETPRVLDVEPAPGLHHYGAQPVAEAMLDLLFPETRYRKAG